jgi:hypothetical protein
LSNDLLDELDDQLLFPSSASPRPFPVDVRTSGDDILHEVPHASQHASFFSKILLQNFRAMTVVEVNPVAEVGAARAEPELFRSMTII